MKRRGRGQEGDELKSQATNDANNTSCLITTLLAASHALCTSQCLSVPDSQIADLAPDGIISSCQGYCMGRVVPAGGASSSLRILRSTYCAIVIVCMQLHPHLR